ncbi:MAG: hypothetical protein KDB88_10915 [Flavobacteriales bacterium]|nr:hypothetical protein [Flavobacteriales bacterium]
MRAKRFRTKRLWYNSIAWLYGSAVLLVLGVIGLFSTGDLRYVHISILVALVGMGVAWSRDRQRESIYLVDRSALILRRSGRLKRIAISDIIDASLVERSAARNYIVEQVSNGSDDPYQGDPKERMAEFVRYCSVDIGLSSYTFGLGRRVIDRLPKAKNDLVLVRTRSGQDRLLSPLYNQDFVESLSRAMRQHTAATD